MLMLRIGLKKGCSLKKMWKLVGLMTLWLMIIDEWLVYEGVVLVVVVLFRLFSSYDISVLSRELLLELYFVRGEYIGVAWEI